MQALDKLVFGALSKLQALGYNARSIRRYQSTWKRLIAFAKKHNFKSKLSEKLIAQFLEYYNIKPEELATTQKGWRKHAEFSVRILWQFSRYGYFERLNMIMQTLSIPPVMKAALDKYVKYCVEKRHISKYCCNERIRQVSLLLDFIGKRNVQTFNQIRPQHLLDFINLLWRYSTKTKSRIVSDIRQFLKYLFLRGILTHDIAQALPTIRVASYDKIPSVWDRALINKLLTAVDRSSAMGKRDYAMLLLACRLGLRTGDIRNLTFDQINWEAETISLIQSKTQRPLTLPLTNEMGNALIDYIKFARPQMNYRQIFLRLTPPFTPLRKDAQFYHVLKNWRTIAGIHFRTKQRQGMQSLRHSFATYLLEENTPFSLIADILGHSSMNSTMIYAKSSVEMLRQVALSLKEVDHVD